MRQRFVFVVLLNLILLLSMSLSNAQDERLQIVGSHSILSDVIANVAGDVADVTSVMPKGADPHSFLPSPSDLTALADADVVFINGAFFEEGLLEVIENAGDDMNIVTASSCVEIIAFGGHDEHGDEEHAHEEGEEHRDEEHEDEEGEDHEHGDEEHAHEEGEDHEHGDEEHSEMGDMSAIAMLCEQHYAEMEALHEDSHEHGDEEHEEGEEHAHDEDEDHEHGDEEHEHGKVETLGALYQADCGEGHDGHNDEEEGEHEEGDEHGDEHDHGACDPHVWMEPHNVMYWTMLIRDTLIELDPANADVYTANASEYLETVDALVHDFVIPMVETLPEENRVLITNHDAFGYFVARYEFEVVGTIIPSLSTLAEASTADVAETIDLIREQNIPAIFAETTVSDDLAQQIAEETGAQLYILYSGSLSDEDGPASTYIDYIRYNVTTIVEALGGGM